MARFGRKRRAGDGAAPPTARVDADLPRTGDALPASLTARSDFVKRVSCAQCGGPKTLPSPTAYLYCDFCGQLVDYDFRRANRGTNAGLTNTVFHRLVAEAAPALVRARTSGDRDAYLGLQRQVFSRWLEHCPDAASPRARTDERFRSAFVEYCAASTTAKDLDPAQADQNARSEALAASLQRIPTPGGAWRVAGPFREYAALFKRQMEEVYAMLDRTGVTALDPDHPPGGVAVRMELSTFCQAWLAHLSDADGDRLLREYGLDADYVEVTDQPTEGRTCGGCGADLRTVPGARVVVCDACGRRIEVGAGRAPCRACGVELSYPEGADRVTCPACGSATQRV